MTKNLTFAVILFLIFFIPFGIESQALPNRYVDPVFPTVLETKNILFSTDVPQPKPGGGFYEFLTGLPLNAQEDNFDLVDLYMDVFEPEGDTMEFRPLIIIAFGGGFLDNDRNDWAIRLLAQSLANQGFVTASIDYRLGMNVFDMEKSKRAVYRGLQDGRSAVRYFKNDAATTNTFRVDTNNIFMGGHSSGGFIAIHTAYLDKDSERPQSTREGVVDGDLLPDQKCIDCVGDNTTFTGDVKAIFNLAGAIGEIEYIESSLDPPIISFHSSDDGTVPYNSGEPFSNVSTLIVGSDLPIVYGSQPIADRANSIGLSNLFYSYSNRGHDVHIATSVSLHSDIVPGISHWFNNNCLKPLPLNIDGNQIFCSKDTIQHYSASTGDAKYFEWEVIGGTIVQGDLLSNRIVVDWDPLASMHSIGVTPYSVNGARGDKSMLPIMKDDGQTLQWVGTDGSWMDPLNWDPSRIPLPCDFVEIQSNMPKEITIDQNEVINVQGLTLSNNVILNLLDNVALSIIKY